MANDLFFVQICGVLRSLKTPGLGTLPVPEILHVFFGVLFYNIVVVPVHWQKKKKNNNFSYSFNLMTEIPVYQLIISHLCSHLHSPLMVYWFLTDCSFLSLH